MRARRVLLAQLALCVILAGCVSPATIEATVQEEGATPTRPLPVTRVLPTRTPTEEAQEPYCLDTSLWHRLWVYNLEVDGPPQAVRVGPDDDYWFLLQHSVVHRVGEGEYTRYRFGDLLDCSECSIESNGTIAIAPQGSAWIGLSNGLLEVARDGTVRYLESAEIFPESGDEEGPLVLVVDTAGRVWTSNTMGWLCHMEGAGWECVHLNELPSLTGSHAEPDRNVGYAMSAVRGRDDQIWFGTGLGFVLNYQGGRYAIEDLRDLFPGFRRIYGIGAMAFDELAGALWAVETTPPYCAEGILRDTMGVFSRGSDGEWVAFEKSLFSPGIEDACWGAFSSIAVTEDGRVWAGMTLRHGLVLYDGQNWRTLTGEPLPSTHPLFGAVCNFVEDIAATADGHLLVLNQLGIFEYVGADP
jgi:streptogramin lyase